MLFLKLSDLVFEKLVLHVMFVRFAFVHPYVQFETVFPVEMQIAYS